MLSDLEQRQAEEEVTMPKAQIDQTVRPGRILRVPPSLASALESENGMNCFMVLRFSRNAKEKIDRGTG